MTENKNKFLAEALFNLSPASEWELQDGKIKQWFKGERPTEEEIDVEVKRLEAEYDSQEYARQRAEAYPSVGDQLDMIYKDMKNSTTTHAEAVEAVKTKYPKGD